MNLASLKEGDWVAVHSGTWNASLEKRQIERVTTMQIVLTDKSRYTRSRGHMVGASTWANCRIEPWTVESDQRLSELRAERTLKRDRAHLSGYPWSTLDRATVDAVLAALKGPKA